MYMYIYTYIYIIYIIHVHVGDTECFHEAAYDAYCVGYGKFQDNDCGYVKASLPF